MVLSVKVVVRLSSIEDKRPFLSVDLAGMVPGMVWAFRVWGRGVPALQCEHHHALRMFAPRGCGVLPWLPQFLRGIRWDGR